MHEIQQTISNYFDPNEYSSNHKTEEIWEQNPEYGAAVHKNTRISILADRMHLILLVVVGTFGLLWTFMLISTDVNSSFFEAYSNLVKYLPDDTEEDGTTLVSSKKWGIYFYWIPKYIFDKNVLFSDELAREIPQTEKVITIGASPKDKDKSLILNSTLVGEVSNMARNYDREIYPYTNMMYNELAELNIEANY